MARVSDFRTTGVSRDDARRVVASAGGAASSLRSPGVTTQQMPRRRTLAGVACVVSIARGGSGRPDGRRKPRAFLSEPFGSFPRSINARNHPRIARPIPAIPRSFGWLVVQPDRIAVQQAEDARLISRLLAKIDEARAQLDAEDVAASGFTDSATNALR